MKSKEFGASYRTYRAKSQSMLVENQLAQPHSSVRVLTESINRSPVEFMQYFRTIMEAPPNAKGEPTIPPEPTATPGGQSSPASSSRQSMFTKKSPIIGQDGKPITIERPVDPANIRRVFNSRKNKELPLTQPIYQALSKLIEKVDELLNHFNRLSDKLPDETKNQIAKQKTLFERALDTIIEELDKLRTKPITTGGRWVGIYLVVIVVVPLFTNYAWPYIKDVARAIGEETGLLSLLSTIKGLIESLNSSIKEAPPPTNVPPLPLPQSGDTPPNPPGTSTNPPTTPNPPPGTSTNPPTTPGTDGATEAIKKKAMELLKNAQLTFTALSA